jgi:GxxExxY protein
MIPCIVEFLTAGGKVLRSTIATTKIMRYREVCSTVDCSVLKREFTTETQRTQRLHRERQAGVVMDTPINRLTHEVIGASIEVHRKLGPGLLESAYKECLCRELILRGVPFERERTLPLEYKGIRLECGYRVDILAGGSVVVEIKSVEALAPIHDAQILTYLRLGGWRVGLLINFNVVVLKDGIHRKIMGYDN